MTQVSIKRENNISARLIKPTQENHKTPRTSQVYTRYTHVVFNRCLNKSVGVIQYHQIEDVHAVRGDRHKV